MLQIDGERFHWQLQQTVNTEIQEILKTLPEDLDSLNPRRTKNVQGYDILRLLPFHIGPDFFGTSNFHFLVKFN